MENSIVISGYADIESLAKQISINTGISFDNVKDAIENIIDSESMNKIKDINELSKKLKL